MAKKIKKKESDEPSLIHYLIVLSIIFGIILFGYLGTILYEKYYTIPKLKEDLEFRYTYPYVVGNITYNVELFFETYEIVQMPYQIEISKDEIFQAKSFTFYFPKDYENGEAYNVLKTSSRIFTFLKYVYVYNIDKYDILEIEDIEKACENSTTSNKVIAFNHRANYTKVKYDNSNGCIQFLSEDDKKMVELGDKFLFNLISS